MYEKAVSFSTKKNDSNPKSVSARFKFDKTPWLRAAGRDFKRSELLFGKAEL